MLLDEFHRQYTLWLYPENQYMLMHSEIHSKILNRVQRDIPLVSNPFMVLAEELSLDTDALMDALKELKARGIIRNISGIFEAASLGYASTLVAFEVRDPESAQSIINAHPGVSHNYLRNHRFNLWFTLSMPQEEDIYSTTSKIAALVHARDYIILPTTTRFKIGVHFKIGEDSDYENNSAPASHHVPKAVFPLPIAEREAVRLLQKDLPIEKNPFRAIIERSEGRINETILLDIGNALKERGVLRRYSAVLRHHKAGYSANAMTAWKTDGLTDDDIVSIFGKNAHISHLYIRRITPGKWEYPLFAMIHAKSDAELDSIISALSFASGVKDYCVLKTLQEYKKERVEYFSEEFAKWNKLND